MRTHKRLLDYERTVGRKVRWVIKYYNIFKIKELAQSLMSQYRLDASARDYPLLTNTGIASSGSLMALEIIQK